MGAKAPGRAAFLDRVSTRMERVDRMSPEVRAVVHDWGLSIVDALVAAGVTKPRHMRHVIATILQETRGVDAFAPSWPQ